jgi:hypothetical protein
MWCPLIADFGVTEGASVKMVNGDPGRHKEKQRKMRD